MNIKILDSWLRDYLKTDATPKQIAESLSLTSAGIERVEKRKGDYLYDIEVTTNRVDLASVVGLAREAGAVLPQSGYKAEFTPPRLAAPTMKPTKLVPLTIKNHDELVYRTLAVVLEVKQKKSPESIKDRLEASDIRSLSNLIDITNYVMRTIGYPTHIMDYDRIAGNTLIIREAKKGEEITTLDGKTYSLPGGDLVAKDGSGNIVDLLGIMGLQNSVVSDTTTRIIFFINNDDPHRIRKTSMTLGTRTEAAQLNEKGLDPELAYDALLFGINLFEELAEGKVTSEIIDIYPAKPKEKTVSVTEEKINAVIGVQIPLKQSAEILETLGFRVIIQGNSLEAVVPSIRLGDIEIPEDLIEEIARVYGYHNIPDALPPVNEVPPLPVEDEFFWEKRVKQAMKYWGYTEVYTYPMVSETMYEGPLENAVKLKNPLGEEFAYMRSTLVPSLLQVIKENKSSEMVKIFEISNVYHKVRNSLPLEIHRLAIVIKKPNASFFEIKGLIEQLAEDMGVSQLTFRAVSQSGLETAIFLGKEPLGTIEVLDDTLVNAELDFDLLTKNATTRKTFIPLQKYPPILEDISLTVDDATPTGDIIESIQKVSPLIAEVTLLDRYNDSRTFHIIYQSSKKNLTTEEVEEIRVKILSTLKTKYHASLKT